MESEKIMAAKEKRKVHDKAYKESQREEINTYARQYYIDNKIKYTKKSFLLLVLY